VRCVALLPLLPLLLGSPADQPVPPEKPPPERWRETFFQLDWPAPQGTPNPWGCRAGHGARVVLDRVRTLRDKPRTDTVQVWLRFMNGSLAPCSPPLARLFTDRGLQRDEALRPEGGWSEVVEPRQSGREIVAAAVPIGTRALWLTARESPLRLRIDLERGSAELLSPEGTVVTSAEGRARPGTPDPHPSSVRIPVGERFPGVSMVQADGVGGCSASSTWGWTACTWSAAWSGTTRCGTSWCWTPPSIGWPASPPPRPTASATSPSPGATRTSSCTPASPYALYRARRLQLEQEAALLLGRASTSRNAAEDAADTEAEPPLSPPRMEMLDAIVEALFQQGMADGVPVLVDRGAARQSDLFTTPRP